MPRRLTDPALDTGWTVVALCAEWCSTCRDYRIAFEAHAAARDDAQYVWVDIEDDADWLGEVDVETFPTLLVLCGSEPRFYGPLLPAIDVLDRTLRAVTRRDGARSTIPAAQRAAIERLIERIARAP